MSAAVTAVNAANNAIQAANSFNNSVGEVTLTDNLLIFGFLGFLLVAGLLFWVLNSDKI